MDASAALDITTIETRQSALGISTLGILGRLIHKPDGTVTTKPGEITTVTTKPGEATILINGKPVGLVNTTNNTITLTGGGTFRLAPGQTMEQFLGNRGLVSPITEIIPASDGIRMTFRLTN